MDEEVSNSEDVLSSNDKNMVTDGKPMAVPISFPVMKAKLKKEEVEESEPGSDGNMCQVTRMKQEIEFMSDAVLESIDWKSVRKNEVMEVEAPEEVPGSESYDAACTKIEINDDSILDYCSGTSESILDEGEEDVENSSREDEASDTEANTRSIPNVEASFKKPNALKSTGLTSFQSKLLEKLDSLKTDNEDADKSFLLSLLPDYKKLNNEEKLDFRFHTLQFFRDLRRKSTPPVITQLTSSFQYPNDPQPQHFPNYHSEYQGHSKIYYNTRFSSAPPHSPPPTPSPVPLSVHFEDSENIVELQ